MQGVLFKRQVENFFLFVDQLKTLLKINPWKVCQGALFSYVYPTLCKLTPAPPTKPPYSQRL